MSSELAGVFPVFQTPYHDDESIDFETLEREIDWLFDRGADGLALAMVSEVLRLSSEERDSLAESVCKLSAGRGPVIISVGAESSYTAVRHAHKAVAAGASAVMAIPPLASRLDDEALYYYYDRLLKAIELPVIIQDASGYVGPPLSLGLQTRLLHDHGPERVLFKLEGVPLGPRLSVLRETTKGRARVFEGSGGIALLDNYRRGIVGTMPAADLIEGVVALWGALESNDFERAYELSMPIVSLVSMQQSLDAFIAIEKYLLVKQGIFRNARIRGPVGYVLDEETRAEVDRLFERLQATLAESR